jgi:hypothetical protein
LVVDHPDRDPKEDEDGLTATLTQREEDGDRAILNMLSTTASTTSRAEDTENVGQISKERLMGNLEDELFNSLDVLDFDEC